MGQDKSTCYIWIFLKHLTVFLIGCSFLSYSLLDFIHTHLNWFKAYLMGREQRVVVDSSNSDWLPVLSGVTQGSILGPMLFLCYINDMPNYTQNSTTALFVDDSKCFRPIHCINDCLLLQKDIDSLYNWGQMWDLHYNPSKCHIISVTRKRNVVKFDYCMNDTVLCRADSIKDLGIDISSSLVLEWSY